VTAMQQILVHADSLSWGIVPNTRRRLDFDESTASTATPTSTRCSAARSRRSSRRS